MVSPVFLFLVLYPLSYAGDAGSEQLYSVVIERVGDDDRLVPLR